MPDTKQEGTITRTYYPEVFEETVVETHTEDSGRVEDKNLAHEIALATDGIEMAAQDATVQSTIAKELLRDNHAAGDYAKRNRDLARAADYVAKLITTGQQDRN